MTKIITISRQYGSGGKAIGERLAKRLNIPFYDKELVELASKSSEINLDVFTHEEEIAGAEISYLSSLQHFLHEGSDGLLNLSVKDRMFIAQSEVIEELANQGPAVFVGRCGDVVLKNHPSAIHVFIKANEQSRKERVINDYGVESEKALLTMKRIDHRRKHYYEYYTGRRWGDMNNYDLVIDSSKFDIDEIVDMLEIICQ